MRALGIVLCVAAVVAGCGGERAAARAAPALTEASGLITASAGGWWTHNDSGGGPWLYRIDATGDIRQRVFVTGATALDWEDLTALERDGRRWLLIADTGDNWRLRPQVAILAVPEPRPAQREVAVAWRIDLRYPDGPRDVEGIAYDPHVEDLLLVSKREDPPRIFRVPATATTADAPASPVPVAALAALSGPDRPSERPAAFAWMPTGLALTADGSQLAVSTIHGVLRYRRGPDGWAASLAAAPYARTTLDLPQIEGLCFAADGRLHLISEGSPEIVTLPELAPHAQ